MKLTKYAYAAIIIAFVGALQLQAQAPQPLFRDIPPDRLNELASAPDVVKLNRQMPATVKRSRLAEVSLSVLDTSAADRFKLSSATPDSGAFRVALNLFDDLRLTLVIKSVQTNSDGKSLIWQGRVEGEPNSGVTIVKTGSIVTGNITTEQGVLIEVRPVSDTSPIHSIREMDKTKFPPDGEPLPARPPLGAGDIPRAPNLDDGSIIDVMVLHTEAAVDAVGGPISMNSLIQQGLAETNAGYEASGITQRIRIVHVAQVVFDDNKGFNAALTALASPNDRVMDEIHGLRDQFGADMVSLWINNDILCGLAYYMSDMSRDFSQSAFSVVHHGCATGYYSFAHEMGHNQGANHNAENATPPSLFPYSHGYRSTTNLPFWRTVMSYNCAMPCERQNIWSNPDLEYKGVPAGIRGQSDNRLTLNTTNIVAARWRKSIGIAVPADTTAARAKRRLARDRE